MRSILKVVVLCTIIILLGLLVKADIIDAMFAAMIGFIFGFTVGVI